MRSPILLALIVSSILSAGVANAEPFTILPDGSVVFNTVLTSSATFTCLSTVPCTGSGTNSVTIGSGASTATLTFTGVSTSFQTANISKTVSVGSVESAASDGFIFPTRTNPRLPILRFDLTMTHTSPVAATRRKGITFRGGRPDLPMLQANNSSVVFPIGPQPPGAHYAAIVYSFSPWPIVIGQNRTTNLTTKVGAVPEPSTLILLGSGLAWGAYARRRRRSSKGS